MLLKNEGRIEALFLIYFLALLVQALLEREVRLAMQKEKLADLPLYPEERASTRPTTDTILKLFGHIQRSLLLHDGKEIKKIDPELTDLQKQILHLLGVPLAVYKSQ